MNDKINEILAYFEEYVKISDLHDSEPMLNWKDLKIVLDYITNLKQDNANYVEVVLHDRKIIDNLQQRIYKARKMIFDNYGLLDKYEIEMLDDILKGDNNEQ